MNRWEKYEKLIEEKLAKKYEELFPSINDFEKFVYYMKKRLRPSIRINTLKIEKEEILDILKSYGLELEQIPWYEYGYWVNNYDEDFFGLGNLKEHALGFFYIQEAASMIPPLVLDLEKDNLVLDVAAAPGSKTTQIAQIMDNNGLIIANDVSKSRLEILVTNLQRMGVYNTIVYNYDGRRIHERFKVKFDRILLDAPCSAEGTIRRSYGVLNDWGEKLILSMSRLQRQLIISAFEALKPKGILVYSTCTLDQRENEFVVSYLLNKYENAKVLKIEIEGLKYRKGITEWNDYTFREEVKNTIRIWPHDNDTEGFYIAKITKEY